MSPERVLDTRTSVGGHPGPLGAHLLTVAGVGGVPDDATAVAINVTVTGATDDSYLTVQPAGQAQVLVSSLNFGPGQTVANVVTVKLGTGGRIWLNNAVGTVDVVADLSGYYVLAGPAGPAGAIGPQGVAGPPGADGTDGTDDAPGTNGSDGVAGADGPQGPTGPPGDAGSTGSVGATGATGPAGSGGSPASVSVHYWNDIRFIASVQPAGTTMLRDDRTTRAWHDLSSLSGYPANVAAVSTTMVSAIDDAILTVTVQSTTGAVAETRCTVGVYNELEEKYLAPGQAQGPPAYPANCTPFTALWPVVPV